MLLRCYLSTFQTFFFPTVNEPYIGFQPVQLSIEQLRIFILFNFRRLNIYPPAFVRGCGFGQIHSGKEGAFERNTVEQGSTLKYSGANTFLRILSWKKYSAAKPRTEIQRPNTFLRVLRSCDLESGQCFPFRIGPGAVFRFCQSWFLSDSSSCWRLWQERRLTSKFAPSSIFACIANRN